MSAWTGDLGDFWAAHAEQYERLLARHAARLVDAAGLTGTERVLDVGCGTGPTSRLAGERAASVLGLDVSSTMVATAIARTHQPNVDFAVGDAQTVALPRVDVVISQFGLMFFDDPATAFANLGHALERDGRLAFLCWRSREENENRTLPREVAGRHAELPPLSQPDGPGPFALAEPDLVRSLLADADFGDVRLEAVDLPMTWGSSLDGAVSFVVEDHLDWLEPGSDAYDATVRDLREELEARELLLGSAFWLVTARR